MLEKTLASRCHLTSHHFPWPGPCGSEHLSSSGEPGTNGTGNMLDCLSHSLCKCRVQEEMKRWRSSLRIKDDFKSCVAKTGQLNRSASSLQHSRPQRLSCFFTILQALAKRNNPGVRDARFVRRNQGHFMRNRSTIEQFQSHKKP